MHEEEIKSNVEPVSREFIPREEWQDNPEYQAYRLLDDSMNLEIEKGDIIIVKAKEQYKSGSLVVATVDDSCIVFRGLTVLPKDRMILFPFDLKNYDLICISNASKRVKIHGDTEMITRTFDDDSFGQTKTACPGATEQAESATRP